MIFTVNSDYLEIFALRGCYAG